MTRDHDGHHAGHRWRTAPPEGEWWPSRGDDDKTEAPQRREWRGAKYNTDEEEQ